MVKPPVYVVHTETGLREGVVEAIELQGFRAITTLTSVRTPFGYGDKLRKFWRLPYQWLLVEHDVIMPAGTLQRLADCKHDWCTHPHWMGSHMGRETTGVVRWSLRLRRRYPAMMDDVCAAPDNRFWVRMGWTQWPRDCNARTLNGPARHACLLPGKGGLAASDDPQLRPTSHDWHGIDSDLAYKLHAAGIDSHMHPEPTIHLHDYAKFPPGIYQPWTQRDYIASEWEG